MRRILSGFLGVKRTRHERKIGRSMRPTRSALTGQAQSGGRFEPSVLDPERPQVDRPRSLLRNLVFIPAIQWEKRMQETLLDFDTADASGEKALRLREI
jgi:hypothetical protein